MSHFTVLVIGENPEEQLAPFSENIRVPEYKRDEVYDDEKERFTKFYTTYDPSVSYGPRSQKQAEVNAELSFDQLYKLHGDDWNGDTWRKDENGVWFEYSTYNKNSKWDWYALGGRWSGMIKVKEGAYAVVGRPGVFENEVGIDQARKGDIINLSEINTFAVLKDGKWYERGEMGWFAIVVNEKSEEQWKEEFLKLLEELPDEALISIYDCHI